MNRGLVTVAVSGTVAGITIAIALGSVFYAKKLVDDAKQKTRAFIDQHCLTVAKHHEVCDEYEKQLAEAKATIHEHEITIAICEEMINKLNLKIKELNGETKHQM
jgi:hypothetical protein